MSEDDLRETAWTMVQQLEEKQKLDAKVLRAAEKAGLPLEKLTKEEVRRRKVLKALKKLQ